MQLGCTLLASGELPQISTEQANCGQTQPNLVEMSEIPTTRQIREPKASAHHCSQLGGFAVVSEIMLAKYLAQGLENNMYLI